MKILQREFTWLRQAFFARMPFIKGVISPRQYISDKGTWINSSFPNPYVNPGNQLLEIETALKYFGSDKAIHHDYQFPYSLLIDQIKSGSLIEVGIGTKNQNFSANMGWFLKGKPGGSLRAWNSLNKFDYVIGGDIDDKVLFTEDKIRTFQVDQLDEKSLTRFKNNCFKVTKKFSLIIDDGLHDASANILTCKYLFPLLQEKGIYVIEDIKPHQLTIILNETLKNSKIKDWAIWQNCLRSPDNVMLIIFKK